MKRTRQIVLIASLLMLSSSVAMAGQPVQSIQEREKQHSVNISPFGLVLGTYNVNYEYLSGQHGFLVEADFGMFSSASNATRNYGFDLGYRWHWSGQQNSSFLGLNAGYSVSCLESMMVTTKRELHAYPFEKRGFHVTGNVGRRWVWDWGLNVTARVGVGYGHWSVTASNDDNLDVQLSGNAVQEAMEMLPIAYDGELSVGYTF